MTIRATPGAEPGGTGLSNRTTAIGIFLLAFGAFAWLAPLGPFSPLVVTRLGLTLSIVESGRVDIDRFADRTIDKALFEGHYYADKVPGHALYVIGRSHHCAWVRMRWTKTTASPSGSFA